EHVSCTACHAVHPYDTEVEKNQLIGKNCSSVEPFPGSTRCGNRLFSVNNRSVLKPIRSFYYNSLVSTLQAFFLREGFVDDVRRWKSRTVIPGIMSDVYDGSVWRDFKMDPTDDMPYVQQSDFNLMLTINCDWFQLYTNSVYSCGGIYLTIQNLPRDVRNLRKNVVLVCLLPGPGEPKTFQMNHYLRLLVDELLLLSNGVQIQTRNHGIVTVKAALTMVACDLPATRKVIGMTSHNSTNACNYCTHLFESIPGHTHRRNYADAPRNDDWIVRDPVTHRLDAEIWKRATTATARTNLEKTNGVRYSELLRLPYFNPIEFVAFDICHNTFMGTAKRMMRNIWREENNLVNDRTEPLITKDHLKEMSKSSSQNFVLPFGYDGLSMSRKMTVGDVGFGHVKSDEFKTWVLAMSPYLLSMRLPKEYYDNWMDFVAANVYLSSPMISLEEVDLMHDHMKKFLNDFVTTYNDPTLFVSNMHFHSHLRENLLRFGPGPSSWIFNFERYNCDIKSIKTNRKGAVEKTFMLKFLRAVHAKDYYSTLNSHLILASDDNKKIERLFSGGNIHGYDDVHPWVEKEYVDSLHAFSLYEFLAINHGHQLCYGYEQLPPSALRRMKVKDAILMDPAMFNHLLDYYTEVYNCTYSALTTDRNVYPFATLDLFGSVYKSMESSCTNARGSYIRAFYRLNYDNDIIIENETVGDRAARHYRCLSNSGVLRPAQVMMFFRHSADVLGDDNVVETIMHTFALVRWFKGSDIQLGSFAHHNMSVYANEFEDIVVIHLLLLSITP
ncbi:hypothetical protein INT47_007909, partial [Mucor saturninus]